MMCIGACCAQVCIPSGYGRTSSVFLTSSTMLCSFPSGISESVKAKGAV